jgi:predicted nucleic acid-binding protein
MGERYLLDTNTVLDYMGNKFTGNAKTTIARIIDFEINLSVINKIELLGFSKVEQDLIDFVNCSNICPMDDEIVEKTIEVRRLYKIKLPDAVIAATALQSNFTLVTNNTKDFKNIEGLEFINPNDG